jgi:hypothetical protein
MAISFKFYEDSALTIPLGTTLSIGHRSDLSDNPKDFDFYFGSTNSAVKLQVDDSIGTPGVTNITISPTDILPAWEASKVYTTGAQIEPTTPNGYRYQAQNGGTTGASQPTWPTSGIGSTVTDGSIVWKLVSTKHQTSEIKLATSSGGLSGAIAGGSLSLGPTVNGGVSNAVHVYMRVTNAVTASSSGTDLALYINAVEESNI